MTPKRAGICRVCKKTVRLTASGGRVMAHGPKGNRCAGTGNYPEHSWTEKG